MTRKRFIVDLLDDDNNNETEQFIRKYGADEITGTTNGDVIKVLFPDIESRIDKKTGVVLVKWADGTTKCFKASWWNAPYKGRK